MDRREVLGWKKAKRRRRRVKSRVRNVDGFVLTDKGIKWLMENGLIKNMEVSNGESS